MGESTLKDSTTKRAGAVETGATPHRRLLAFLPAGAGLRGGEREVDDARLVGSLPPSRRPLLLLLVLPLPPPRVLARVGIAIDVGAGGRCANFLRSTNPNIAHASPALMDDEWFGGDIAASLAADDGDSLWLVGRARASP